MKISNFKAIIREAVKEELRASLPKLLKIGRASCRERV